MSLVQSIFYYNIIDGYKVNKRGHWNLYFLVFEFFYYQAVLCGHTVKESLSGLTFRVVYLNGAHSAINK